MRLYILAFLLAATAPPARAGAGGVLGAGVMVGEPVGLTLKRWLNDSVAIDGGAGYNGDAVFYATVLWHSWSFLPQPGPGHGKLGGYLGLGPRLQASDERQWGMRALGGMTYRPAGQPLEFFLEAGPLFQFSSDTGVDVNATLGARFYFGGGRGA